MKRSFVLIVIVAAIAAISCKKNESAEADNLYSQGKYEQAIGKYNEYLKIYPRHVKSLYNRGRCYEELGQYERAMEDFNKALEIDPKNTQALQSVGLDFYRLRTGRFLF